MKRKQLLDLLAEYTPYFPEDEIIASRTRDFVIENSLCFERSLASGHITGSCWIVDSDRSHALFTHHKKLNKWLQLGGHADGDSDILQVALKEAAEESGLHRIKFLSEQIFDIDIHSVPDRGQGHYHYDVRFLLEADRNEPFTVSDESHAIAWIDLSKIQDITTEPSILRMHSKMRHFSEK
jgi:8-oxo-dGTP pyrophosphatase MutT (NUDIX family)